MRFRTLVAEAWRSLAANASTTIAATMTVLIAMFILGLSIGLGTWALSWSNHVKKQLVVHVYFCTQLSCGKDATQLQEEKVGNLLSPTNMPEVKSVKFVSKAQALTIMRKSNPELTKQLPGNPLPDAFEVTPKNGNDVEKIAAKIPTGVGAGVEKVDYGKKTAKRILRVARVLEIVFLLAVVVLLIASTLLIANTIRLSIFSRRREIEVMKLVGATNWFVRGPFMLEGLICGVAGSFLAVVLLLLGKEIAMPAILGHISDSTQAHAIAFAWTTLILIGSGIILGAAGSGVTIRRFLKV
ncbi:MAG: cell division protein FtsX [Gaiellaceae bacterium]